MPGFLNNGKFYHVIHDLNFIDIPYIDLNIIPEYDISGTMFIYFIFECTVATKTLDIKPTIIKIDNALYSLIPVQVSYEKKKYESANSRIIKGYKLEIYYEVCDQTDLDKLENEMGDKWTVFSISEDIDDAISEGRWQVLLDDDNNIDEFNF